MRRLPAALALLLAPACAPSSPAPIALEQGEYYAVPPASWDGREALPVLLYYHGAGGHPRQYYGDPEVLADFDAAGALLLLPVGIEGHWGSDPGWEGGRDEYAFADAILADAAGRYPLDPGRTYVGGFSIGGALASMMACEHSAPFAAAAPMSGGFWYPAPASCPAEPIPVSHTHGLADQTWPIEGHCFEESGGLCTSGQAAIADTLDTWLAQHGCGEATAASEDGPLSCTTWTDCRGGPLRYCQHEEGHTRLEGWAARQLSWLLGASGG